MEFETLLTTLTLTPNIANILKNCSFIKFELGVLHLNLSDKFQTLLTDNLKVQIDKVLQKYCKVIINISHIQAPTLAEKEQNLNAKKSIQAQQKFFNDKNVIALQKIFETNFNKKLVILEYYK